MSNNPFSHKVSKNKRDRQYTLAAKIAGAAGAEADARRGSQKNYDETSYFYGYRDAWQDLCKLLEGELPTGGNVALALGAENYLEWLHLHDGK